MIFLLFTLGMLEVGLGEYSILDIITCGNFYEAISYGQELL